MRKALVLGTAVAAAATVALGAPASAETATFTLTAAANSVSISVPGNGASLGSTTAGSLTHSAQLGTVTVTDDRAKLLPQWTVSVASTPFVLSGGDANDPDQAVPAASVSYTPGLATLGGPGSGVYTPTPALTLAAPAVVGAYVGVSGSRTVSWNPTVGFTLRASQLAGTYTGTITHSVTVIS